MVRHGPEIGAPYTGADELALLGAWVARLAVVFPALADPAGLALAAAQDSLGSLTAVRPGPCHRDFHAKQLLIHAGRAGVLDFDTYRLADPALDIGNLIARVRMTGLREGRCLADFEEAFGRRMPAYVRPENVRAWTRATLLRLGCICAFSSARHMLAEPLLREAARWPAR